MMHKTVLLLSVAAFLIGTGTECVYVFKGDPFQDPGPLDVDTRTLNKDSDGIPARTQVFYPTTPGSYVPVVFLSGLLTVVYEELYSTLLANFAGYGYIVAGIDLYWPVESLHQKILQESDSPKTVFDVIQWTGLEVRLFLRCFKRIADNCPSFAFSLRTVVEKHGYKSLLTGNLNQRVLPSSEGAANVTADWSVLGLMSHSLSADALVQMLYANTTFARAVAFMEPASTHFTKPLGFFIPALSYGTQLCTESPRCCIEGYSYIHFYNMLTCPRIMMNATGYGHCDILNEVPGWDLCHTFDVCKTVDGNNRDLYREDFVPGLLASFFGSYLQGNRDLVKYITTADLMPVPLGELRYEVDCN